MNFIENTFALTTNLLKKDLRKIRAKEPIDGYLNVMYNGKESALDLKVEYQEDQACLIVIFGPEPQRILLAEEILTFGTRTYLTCQCGCRTTALYLVDGTFACRKCKKLKYASNAINTNSVHGKFIYQQTKILRIISMREKMSCIFYRSRYTKRFLKWLGQCGRVGLFDEVIRAFELEEVVKAMNSKFRRSQ